MGKSKIVTSSYDKEHYIISDDRSQRNFVVLKNPAYIIDFGMELTKRATDPIDKYFAIVNKRISQGACFKQPCMGVKEYACAFKFPDGTEQVHPELLGEFNFGQVLKKINFNPSKTGKLQWFDHQQKKITKGNVEPEYFEAIMKNGVVRC
jgi:CRISPR-associated protein Cas5d